MTEDMRTLAASPGPAPGSFTLITRDGEQDAVAVEEPLEVRVDGEPVAVTMRTPGHDEELALGFLFGEGLIDSAREVSLTGDLAANTVDVAGPLLGRPASRRFYTTSSCGVCGKGAIEEIAVHATRPPDGWPGTATPLTRELLAGLPERLVQPGFKRTGGVHATGLFDARAELAHPEPPGAAELAGAAEAAGATELACVREDVGRHNAMDKVIGWALRERRVPLAGHVLCVSGRLSFELVQKALVAGAPVLVGVGAPTSLAVSLAREYGLTLGGFARHGRVNMYSGESRLR